MPALAAFITDLYDNMIENILSGTSSYCRTILLADGQCLDSKSVEAALLAVTRSPDLSKYAIEEAQKEITRLQTNVWKANTKNAGPQYKHSALMEAIVVIRTHRHRVLASSAPRVTFTDRQRGLFAKAAALSPEALRVCGCGW